MPNINSIIADYASTAIKEKVFGTNKKHETPQPNQNNQQQNRNFLSGPTGEKLIAGITSAVGHIKTSFGNKSPENIHTSSSYSQPYSYVDTTQMSGAGYNSNYGGGYPPQGPPQGYPQQGGEYPQQGGGYPQQGYPQQSGGYPQQSGGYPQQSGGYPQQSGGYPQQGGGYPTQPGYPGAPPQVAPYPGYGTGSQPLGFNVSGGGAGYPPVSQPAYPSSGAYPSPTGGNYGQLPSAQFTGSGYQPQLGGGNQAGYPGQGANYGGAPQSGQYPPTNPYGGGGGYSSAPPGGANFGTY